MPVVALPVILFAVGAMICYLLAQPIVRSMFVSAAESVPIVGRYMARGALAIEAKMIDLFKSYVWSSTATFVHWLIGLAQNVAGFAREVRSFAAGVADALDHALTVTVHDIVKAFVNPVRDTANTARQDAADVAADLNRLSGGLAGRIAGAVTAGIAGIWATVHQIVNTATGDVERTLSAYADDVAGHALDAAHAVAGDLAGLEHGLGDLVSPGTAARVIAEAAAGAGAGVLLATEVLPLVRDLTECAPKLKATCQTDMSEWLGLLEGLVLAGSLPSLVELARAAQAAVGDFTDDAASLIGADSAANVPSHPNGWS